MQRLKRFFKLLRNDLFHNERVWTTLLRILGGVIVLLAVAFTVIFVLTGIGWIITLLWREPYIQSRTSGSEQSICDSYTNIGLVFGFFTGFVGYIIYDLFKFVRWLIRRWKESGKEE